jgi:hypothetical protein
VWPLSVFIDSWSGPVGEYGLGLATSPLDQLADWRSVIGAREKHSSVPKK